jgi:hypothetical protein
VELESVRQWLIQSAADVSISAHVGEQWRHAELLLQNATQRLVVAASQNTNLPSRELVEVIDVLERGQQILEDLRYDPALLPPMYLQMDHTLAIFAPLLFPLAANGRGIGTRIQTLQSVFTMRHRYKAIMPQNDQPTGSYLQMGKI